MNIHIDSFSGCLADLPESKRSDFDILEVLRKHPRVSYYDLSELDWMGDAINRLRATGKIIMQNDEFPWYRFEVVMEQ
jgi:hypothetical protein